MERILNSYYQCGKALSEEDARALFTDGSTQIPSSLSERLIVRQGSRVLYSIDDRIERLCT